MKFFLNSAKVRHPKKDINPSIYKKYGFEVKLDEKYNEYVFLGSPEVQVNTIEELFSMIKDFGVELIISEDKITIYNGYIEC